jgi:RNA-binding protein
MMNDEKQTLPERRPKTDLTGKQRRALRAHAHHLEPLVRVGHEGLTDGLASATLDALERHELIKVKLLETAPIEKDDAGPWLAEHCGAHHVGTVGRTVLLYRRHKTTPQIPLPQKS